MSADAHGSREDLRFPWPWNCRQLWAIQYGCWELNSRAAITFSHWVSSSSQESFSKSHLPGLYSKSQILCHVCLGLEICGLGLVLQDFEASFFIFENWTDPMHARQFFYHWDFYVFFETVLLNCRGQPWARDLPTTASWVPGIIGLYSKAWLKPPVSTLLKEPLLYFWLKSLEWPEARVACLFVLVVRLVTSFVGVGSSSAHWGNGSKLCRKLHIVCF